MTAGDEEPREGSPSPDGDAFEFDAATTLDHVGDGRFRGNISDRWSVVGGAPNGGYLMALVVACMRRRAGRPDPLTATGHYVKACEPGPVDVHVETIRSGSRHVTTMGRLVQGATERLRMLCTFGDLDGATGPTHETGTPPDLPPRSECVAPPPDIDLPPIVRRFDTRLTPESAGWAVGQPSGTATMEGWLRFADGRPPDTLSLGLFADALPPTAFNVVDRVRWVPTVELTVHARARPANGWLRAVMRTRFLVDGYLEEDCELWDDEDRLVGQSRQLAMVFQHD